MTDMFTPKNKTQRKALAKLYRFHNAGVMSVEAYLRSREGATTKRISDHNYLYSRIRFNRLNHAEQKEYEKSLHRVAYFVRLGEGEYLQVSKSVFDACNLPCE